THSSRFSSTPAAAADAGSKALLPSMSAHVSSCAVASARIEIMADVRPDVAGPKISVMAPRERPFVTASRGAIPVGTFSTTRLSTSVKGAETRSPSADSNRARRIADCIEYTERQFCYTEQLFGMSTEAKHHG